MQDHILTPDPQNQPIEKLLHSTQAVAETMQRAGIKEIFVDGTNDTYGNLLHIYKWTPSSAKPPSDLKQLARKLADQIIDFSSEPDEPTHFLIRLDNRGFVIVDESRDKEIAIEGDTATIAADIGIEDKIPCSHEERLEINIARLSRALINHNILSPVNIEYHGEGDNGDIERHDLKIAPKNVKLKIWEPSWRSFAQPGELDMIEKEVNIEDALLSIAEDIIGQFHLGYENDAGGGGTVTIDPAGVCATISTYNKEFEAVPYRKNAIIVSEQALDELACEIAQFDQIVCSQAIKQAIEQRLEQPNEAQTPR